MATGLISIGFQSRTIIEEKPGLYPRVELYRARLTRTQRHEYDHKVALARTPLDKFTDDASKNTAAYQAVVFEVASALDKLRAEVMAKQIGKWDLRNGDGEAEITPGTFLQMEPELFDWMMAAVLDMPTPDEIKEVGEDAEALKALLRKKAQERDAPLKN